MKITHTHHIDLDHGNNDPDNLVDLTPKQHAECHAQLVRYYLLIFNIKNTRGAKIRSAVQLAFTPLIREGLIKFDRANLCYFVTIKGNEKGKTYLMPLDQSGNLLPPQFQDMRR